MYERLDKLLKIRGITPYRLAKDIGISQSSLSEWKRGKSIPKHEKLVRIAGYFGVSVEYLTGTNDKLEELEFNIKDKLVAPEWDDEQAMQNIKLFRSLTAEGKTEAIRFLQYLVSIQEAEQR